MVYNKEMKKKLRKRVIKKHNKVKLSRTKGIRIKLSLVPVGDLSTLQEFSVRDLENIKLLDNQELINDNLIDISDELAIGNIYALMDEGVLLGQPTGADLGIYDYEPIIDEKIVEDIPSYDYLKYIAKWDTETNNNIEFGDDVKYLDDCEDDYAFDNCILAEGNVLGGEESQIILTFRGYLEVTKSSFSIIRRCDGQDAPFSIVYMPEYYVRKYQLRNGDEIVCTCKENNGKMLMNSLLTINQISYYNWDYARPWFKNLTACNKVRKLRTSGELTDAINKKFGLYKGDNVFIYINKTSQKSQTLSKLIDELSLIFDKVIYINPQYKMLDNISDRYNIAKFFTSFNDTFRNQATIALLGANYAKRLIELDNNVAIVVDDIDSILALDKVYESEMPISKTILGSTKSTKTGGISSFTMVPLRLNSMKTFANNNILKSIETLGIVIDRNQLDLYHSYRV